MIKDVVVSLSFGLEMVIILTIPEHVFVKEES